MAQVVAMDFGRIQYALVVAVRAYDEQVCVTLGEVAEVFEADVGGHDDENISGTYHSSRARD